MIKLSIRVKTRPYKELEFAQIMESLVKEFRKGNECLSCHFVREKDGRFRLTSAWENMNVLETHLQSTLFSILMGAFHALCEQPQVKVTDGSRIFGMELIEAARNK